MDTFLFNNIIFGSIKSRRYENSLRINLLPDGHKFCNFDCIYCECGWIENTKIKTKYPYQRKVLKLLNEKLIELKNSNKPIDTITIDGVKFDSTNQENIKKWINIILKIKPEKVILYSLDRATTAKHLVKIEKEVLTNIAKMLIHYNITTEVY